MRDPVIHRYTTELGSSTHANIVIFASSTAMTVSALCSLNSEQVRIEVRQSRRNGFVLSMGELRLSVRHPLWLLRTALSDLQRRLIAPFVRRLKEARSIPEVSLPPLLSACLFSYIRPHTPAHTCSRIPTYTLTLGYCVCTIHGSYCSISSL